jgi:AraC-like DNA-binding protein
MHEKVESPWTVESLAVASGMSRSAFALKFKALVGETPLEYLTNWRMHKATAFLRKGDKKLFEVAKAVGYDSDAAFSKAFKRVFGFAPREYERMREYRSRVETRAYGPTRNGAKVVRDHENLLLTRAARKRYDVFSCTYRAVTVRERSFAPTSS